METAIIEVNPTLAKQWLESNTINRSLRRTVVEGLKAMMRRGEYRISHQGIAFSVTGELLDGQHRLTAISEMNGKFSVPLMVTRGLPNDSAKGMDRGLLRTFADVLSIPSGLAAVARYMALIVETTRQGITPQLLIPYVEGVRDSYSELNSFCPKTARIWASSSVRSAAILQMLNGGDVDYIKVTYYALNHAEFDSMSPLAQTLYRQQVAGSATVRTYDMFCRAMKVFDVKQAGMTKLQITDPSTTLVHAREIIASRVIGKAALPTKKAPAKAEAKGRTAARV